MHSIAASLSLICMLLVCIVTEASITDIEAPCLDCHSDPDTRRNVVSLQNFVFLRDFCQMP